MTLAVVKRPTDILADDDFREDLRQNIPAIKPLLCRSLNFPALRDLEYWGQSGVLTPKNSLKTFWITLYFNRVILVFLVSVCYGNYRLLS